MIRKGNDIASLFKQTVTTLKTNWWLFILPLSITICDILLSNNKNFIASLLVILLGYLSLVYSFSIPRLIRELRAKKQVNLAELKTILRQTHRLIIGDIVPVVMLLLFIVFFLAFIISVLKLSFIIASIVYVTVLLFSAFTGCEISLKQQKLVSAYKASARLTWNNRKFLIAFALYNLLVVLIGTWLNTQPVFMNVWIVFLSFLTVIKEIIIYYYYTARYSR